MWDVFISHDTEDKQEIARPLAEALRQAGLRVWFDEFVLNPGDVLSRSIRRGQNESECALIILSPNFFANEKWARRELDGFVNREMRLGKKIIPVWHKVTIQDVVLFSPDIADRLGISTSEGVDYVVRQVLRVFPQCKQPETLPTPETKKTNPTVSPSSVKPSEQEQRHTSGVRVKRRNNPKKKPLAKMLLMIGLMTVVAGGVLFYSEGVANMRRWVAAMLVTTPTPEPTVAPVKTPVKQSTPTPTAIPTSQTAMLTVRSNLYGDKIFIDEKFYGSTRVDVDLPFGLHTVRVEKEGYLPQKAQINLQKASVLELKLEPKPTPIPTTKSVPAWNGVEPITGMEFVKIPGGCFQMGCVSGVDCEDDEKPVHQVCLDEFLMGKTEVTQAQWQRIMGSNPSHFNQIKIGRDTSNYPVENVSWNDVKQFIKKLNKQSMERVIYRLPSEAEWEYASRAGTRTVFSFGNDSEILDEYAWFFKNSNHRTHPVGQLRPNAWGLYDIHGNVLEWCADSWHENYQGAPTDGSTWQTGGDVNYNVLRGGSWSSYYPINLYVRGRDKGGHNGKSRFSGLRLCAVSGRHSQMALLP